MATDIKFSFEGTDEGLARLLAVQERSQLALYKMLYQQGYQPAASTAFQQPYSDPNTLPPELLQQVQQLALPAASALPVASPVPYQYQQPQPVATPVVSPVPQQFTQHPSSVAPVASPAPTQIQPPIRPAIDWAKLLRLLLQLLRFFKQHPGWFGFTVLLPVALVLFYLTPLGSKISNLIPDFPKASESLPTIAPAPGLLPDQPVPEASPSPSPAPSPQTEADLMRDRINKLQQPAVP